jgi:hypothetical protein
LHFLGPFVMRFFLGDRIGTKHAQRDREDRNIRGYL